LKASNSPFLIQVSTLSGLTFNCLAICGGVSIT
jgi:hypothetical protein